MRNIAIAAGLVLVGASGKASADMPIKGAHAVMVSWDQNGDGKLSFAEFERMAAEARKDGVPLPPALVRDAFQSYDLNGDGFITEPEMQVDEQKELKWQPK